MFLVSFSPLWPLPLWFPLLWLFICAFLFISSHGGAKINFAFQKSPRRVCFSGQSCGCPWDWNKQDNSTCNKHSLQDHAYHGRSFSRRKVSCYLSVWMLLLVMLPWKPIVLFFDSKDSILLKTPWTVGIDQSMYLSRILMNVTFYI